MITLREEFLIKLLMDMTSWLYPWHLHVTITVHVILLTVFSHLWQNSETWTWSIISHQCLSFLIWMFRPSLWLFCHSECCIKTCCHWNALHFTSNYTLRPLALRIQIHNVQTIGWFRRKVLLVIKALLIIDRTGRFLSFKPDQLLNYWMAHCDHPFSPRTSFRPPGLLEDPRSLEAACFYLWPFVLNTVTELLHLSRTRATLSTGANGSNEYICIDKIQNILMWIGTIIPKYNIETSIHG